MTESKKLMPGVSWEDIAEAERQEQLAAKAAADKAAAEERQRKIDEDNRRKAEARKAAHNKYSIKRSKQRRIGARDLNGVLGGNVLMCGTAVVFLFAHLITALCGHNYVWEVRGKAPQFKPAKQYIRDAVWPISNGWTYETYTYGDWDTGYTEGGYVYRNESKGKFAPRPIWYIDVACVLVVLLVLSGRRVRVISENTKIRKYNRAIDRQEKIESDAIDMMLDLEEFGKQYNLNTKQVKLLVAKAQEIISNMSADKALYFNMLMAGDFDDIRDKKTAFDMATAIMRGYLATHPEKMKEILEVYDERSISKDLLDKYKPYVH